MTMANATRARRAKGRPDDGLFDRELDHLPPEARWREWMNRVEATIFAASEPVDRETLARIVGKSCSIDLLIDDIREELRGRPYDLVAVAGGWKHLTRPAYADASARPSAAASARSTCRSPSGADVHRLFPTDHPRRASSFFGKEISRDLIGNLRSFEFIAFRPRAPQPGAPYTYVTTPAFLLEFARHPARSS